MKKYFLLILFVVALLPMSLYAEDKNVLGIMDLVAKEGVTQSDASILTDFVFDAAYNFGREKYTIIARDKRDELLEEHKFTFSDLSNEMENTLRAGEYLSADYMIVGSFTKFGSKFFVVVQIVNVNTTEVEGSARRGAADYEGIEQSVNDCIKELFGFTEPEGSIALSPAEKLPASGGFVLVEADTFSMGSTGGKSNTEPVHSVTINKPFYMSKYEVTQKQWREIMGTNPSHFLGDDLPVEQVSWYDAVEYCNALSRMEGLTPCYAGFGDNIECDFSVDGYRLPTEAEWEYAARGGNKSRGFKYSGSNRVSDVAWNWENSGKKPHRVGLKKANELGLYDMSGNVWEWCWDRFDWGYYDISPLSDPVGPKVGPNRVMRGDSWFGGSIFDLFYRFASPPARENPYLGFRIVRTAE